MISCYHSDHGSAAASGLTARWGKSLKRAGRQSREDPAPDEDVALEGPSCSQGSAHIPREDKMNTSKFLVILMLLLAGVACLYAQSELEWLWAKQAGGTGNDEAFRVALDAGGNSYTTGYFSGTAQFGGIFLTSSGGADIFIAKTDPNGNWLWARRAGGTGNDWAYSICTDSEGNSYLTGYFRDSVVFGAMTLSSVGLEDIFIAKVDTNGNWLWAIRAGGSGLDAGVRLALDGSESVLVTGAYDGNATFGQQTLTGNSGYNIFVAKLDFYGEWIWVAQASGTGNMYGNGISTDGGNCYVIGGISGSLNFGGISAASVGNWDICLAKLDGDGNWIWVKRAGGSEEDAGYAISTNSNGNSVITGYFQSRGDFGATALSSAGLQDIFIARLDSEGNWLWAKQAGSTSADFGEDCFTDNGGNCYVIGSYSESFVFESWGFSGEGGNDIFVLRLGISGNLLSATSAGGPGQDWGLGIVTDGAGNCYACGEFASTVPFGTNSLSSSGGSDIWVAKLSAGVPVEEDLAPDPAGLSRLYDAYPNPFREGGTTLIEARIASSESGTLSVCNLRGQVIRGLQLGSGNHQISLASGDLPSGIYLYKLQTPSVRLVKKLVLLR